MENPSSGRATQKVISLKVNSVKENNERFNQYVSNIVKEESARQLENRKNFHHMR